MPQLTAIPSAKFCWICGRAVSLEDGKTDEHGSIVHEECYAARLRLNGSAPPAPR